jgi:hypothetical protein
VQLTTSPVVSEAELGVLKSELLRSMLFKNMDPCGGLLLGRYAPTDPPQDRTSTLTVNGASRPFGRACGPH